MIKAKLWVLAGGPLQSSAGEASAPSQVNFLGRSPPGLNAGVCSLNEEAFACGFDGARVPGGAARPVRAPTASAVKVDMTVSPSRKLVNIRSLLSRTSPVKQYDQGSMKRPGGCYRTGDY